MSNYLEAKPKTAKDGKPMKTFVMDTKSSVHCSLCFEVVGLGDC